MFIHLNNVMNTNKKIYISIGALVLFIVLVCGVLLYTDYQEQKRYDLKDSHFTDNRSTDVQIQDDKQKKQETVYYLIVKDGILSIYKGKGGEFYDYAKIDEASLPPEMYKQLRYGHYITGEQALYDFLQTYSS